MKTPQGLLATAALGTSLFAVSFSASATQLQNYATYSIYLSGVQSPNSGSTSYPGASDTQASYASAPYLPLPTPVHVDGGADTGPNMQGYGFAGGHGYAYAEAGLLGASALAEAQSTAQPDTNVGAGATVESIARYTDLNTFSSLTPTYQNLLIVSGNLLLSGDMTIYDGGFAQVKAGGTGLNSRDANAEWRGDSNGQVKDANGVYSSWVPGSDVSIPFSFTTYSGQETELSYWLDVYASAGASFLTCPSSGGLCDTVQTTGSLGGVDYSHTLAWGGVTVTDWYGNPVNFTSSSLSGFDYAHAYVSAVPVPAAVWLFGSGLLGLIGMARRKIA